MSIPVQIEGKLRPLKKDLLGKYKFGLAFGIATRGLVDIRFMIHMHNACAVLPTGLTWKFIYCRGFPVDVARQAIAEKALEAGIKYLLFVDDDCFIPLDGTAYLLHDIKEDDKDIVTGVVWVKRNPSEPCIYKREGMGSYMNFPKNTVFPIEASGMSCCIIDTKVFEDIPKPWFKFHWGGATPDGRMITRHGEDLYLCNKAREYGFKVWCDSRVLCDHLDVEKNKFYPGKEWVEKLIPQKLKEKWAEKYKDKDKEFIRFSGGRI